MGEMTDPRELFLHELGDVLYVEQTLVKTLPKLQKEATDTRARPELRGSSRGDEATRLERRRGVQDARGEAQGREVPRHRGDQDRARRVRQ